MLYDQIKTPSNVRMFYESGNPQGSNTHERFFFSRATMRFFGDTMKSFGVKRIAGAVYLYRKPNAVVNVFGTWRRAGSDKNLLSINRLDPVTYDLNPVSEKNNPDIWQAIYHTGEPIESAYGNG